MRMTSQDTEGDNKPGKARRILLHLERRDVAGSLLDREDNQARLYNEYIPKVSRHRINRRRHMISSG